MGGANSDSVVQDSFKGGEIKTQRTSAVYGCVLQVVLQHHILVPTEMKTVMNKKYKMKRIKKRFHSRSCDTAV